MVLKEKRLTAHLKRTGEIGRREGGGITRPGFSEEYKQAVKELKEMMEEAGLTVTEDRVGNVFGRREGKCSGAPAIMAGSHLDTVTDGGLYDGNLGIHAALEAVHRMNDNHVVTDHPIEIAAFNAEEGSEMGGTFGSRVMTGRQDLEEKGLKEKLSHYHLTPEDLKSSVRDMSRIAAFVELHIEQGAFLESEHLDIGIVDGIVGITRYQIHIEGESNHAGTTPMKVRRDPVTAAAVLIGEINRKALEYGPPFVATVGNIEVRPGMYNVIPSDVTLYLELRDMDQKRIDRFVEELKKLTAAGEESEGEKNPGSGALLRTVQIKYELQVNKPSKKLSSEVMEAIEAACAGAKDIRYAVMSSGAGHDTKEIIYQVPSAMIFVPSVGGISHSPKEFTTEEQMEKGVEILYETLLRLDQKMVREEKV